MKSKESIIAQAATGICETIFSNFEEPFGRKSASVVSPSLMVFHKGAVLAESRKASSSNHRWYSMLQKRIAMDVGS